MLGGPRAMHNRIARHLAAATALLSLLVASAATGGVLLRCRITGAVQPACCCAADADGQPAKPASVEAGDCCDRIVTDVEQTPSELAPRASDAPPALAALPADAADTGPAIAITARGGRLEDEQSRAGPPTTRARLLSKHAFLI